MSNDFNNFVKFGTTNILLTHLQGIVFHKNPLMNQLLISISGGFILSMTDFINGIISPSNIFSGTKKWSLITYKTAKRIIFKPKEVKVKTLVINSIISNTKDDGDNTLYTAIAWFIDAKRQSDQNDNLEAYSTQQISDMKFKGKNNILTKIGVNQNDSITFSKNGKDYEIEYVCSSNVKEYHKGDKVKKEDNPNITLTYKYYDNSYEDVLKDFCNFCLEEYATFKYPESKALKKWTIRVDNNGGYDMWNRTNLNNKRTYESIILKEGLIEEFKDDLQYFIDNREEYYQLGFQYSRGYLLYGSPGCGKTSLIKAVANALQRDIICLNLSLVNNEDHLEKLFQNVKFESVIVLIEDIDCMTDIVKNRELKKQLEEEEAKKKKEKSDDGYGMNKNNKKSVEQTLTLSGILNFFSGVNDYDGRITFFTSNHPDKVDEALYRSGRVDRVFELGHCDHNQIKRFYKLLLKTDISDSTLQLFEPNKYSPADIVNYFFRYKNSPNFETLIQQNIEKINEKKSFQVEGEKTN